MFANLTPGVLAVAVVSLWGATLGIPACSKPRDDGASERAAPPPSSAESASQVSGMAAKALKAPPPRPAYARRRALVEQGKAMFANGEWDSCARLFETAYDWADAARCASHLSDPARTLDDVQRALVRGRGLDKLRGDPDLAAVAHDPVWQPRWDALLLDAADQLAAYRTKLNAELDKLAHGGEPADQPPLPPHLPDAADAKLFAARIPRVAEILDAHGATLADDYIHAALVYYRADTAADAARAHELALTAIKLDPDGIDSDRAKWLAAAAEDRQLKHQGKPQKYGTQLVVNGGQRGLWDVDPAITDAERERWSVPSLAEAIAGDDGAITSGAEAM
jgi:hypothetical protein